MTTKFYGTGRRKTSVARVYIIPKSSDQRETTVSINQRGLAEHFQRGTSRITAMFALNVTGLEDKFNVVVTVKGGGGTGQAGAVQLGLARALVQYDETLKPVLKKAGLLTRDSREVERKKVGLRKARRRPQFSKR